MTKAGAQNLGRLIVWEFIRYGYTQHMGGKKIADDLCVSISYVYKTAHRLGFSDPSAHSFLSVTPEGFLRGVRKRQQTMRSRVVPVTLPGPDWAKS
jgi:hypothetical protein